MSRFTGLLRSSFGAPASAQSDALDEDDWVPYNGPVEPRTHQPHPHVVGHFLVEETSQRPHITFGALPEIDASRRSSEAAARPQARSAFSLETGGIGESPMAPQHLTQRQHDERKHRHMLHRLTFGHGHSHQSSQNSNTPSSPSKSTFAQSQSQSPAKSSSPTSPPRSARASPPSAIPFPFPSLSNHPEPVTNLLSPTRGSPPPLPRPGHPRPSDASTAMLGATNLASRAMNLKAQPASPPPSAPLPNEPGSSGRPSFIIGARQRSHTDVTGLSIPSIVPEAHLEPSESTSPFSLRSHPFAQAGIVNLKSHNKPPIPPKAPNLLRRIRNATSTPNLLSTTMESSGPANRQRKNTTASLRPRLPPPVHENPISLETESSFSAIMSRRPKFKAAVTGEIPQPPYNLIRPPLSPYDSEKLMLNCLPISKSKGPALGLPQTRDDILTQTVNENKVLDAERAKWAERAKNGFGNSRSRSMSANRPGAPKRSVSHSAALPNPSGLRSSRSDGTVNAKAGLTYLVARTAFGHGHAPKVSMDSSVIGASLYTKAGSTTGLVGPTSSAGHGTFHRRSVSHSNSGSGSRSSGEGRSTRRKNSVARAALKAVVDVCAPTDPFASSGEEPPSPAPVISIAPPRRDTMNHEKIGLALSTPPLSAEDEGPRSASRAGEMSFHPYAQVTSSVIAARAPLLTKPGPHASSPTAFAHQIPFTTSIVARHRLPPQAHYRSPSGASNVTSTAEPTSPTSRPQMTATMSSHPFIKAVEANQKTRPGSIEASFEDAMMGRASQSFWLNEIKHSPGILAGLGILSGKNSNDTDSAQGRSVSPSPQDHHREQPIRQSPRLLVDTQPSNVSVPPPATPPRPILPTSPTSSSPVSPSLFPMHIEFDRRPPSLVSSSKPTPESFDLEEDFDHFRDLFYHPPGPSPIPSIRVSPGDDEHSSRPPLEDADGRPSADWLRSPEDDIFEHSSPDAYSYKRLSNASSVESSAEVHLGAVGALSPNIQDSDRRFSSAFVLDSAHPHDASAVDLNDINFSALSLLQLPSSYAADSPRYSSNSDDGNRTSSSARISRLLQGFPTPPELTPASTAILGSYFGTFPPHDKEPPDAPSDV